MAASDVRNPIRTLKRRRRKIAGDGKTHPRISYTKEQMESIQIAHREAKTWSDWSALAAVRILRWGLDLATGYKHDEAVALGEKDPAKANQVYAMTERKYMIRNVFLEVSRVDGRDDECWVSTRTDDIPRV